MKLDFHPSSTVRLKVCDQCRTKQSTLVAWRLDADGSSFVRFHFCSKECGEAFEVSLALIEAKDDE